MTNPSEYASVKLDQTVTLVSVQGPRIPSYRLLKGPVVSKVTGWYPFRILFGKIGDHLTGKIRGIISQTLNVNLVGGFLPTHLKNMQPSNWIPFNPKDRGKNNTYSKTTN